MKDILTIIKQKSTLAKQVAMASLSFTMVFSLFSGTATTQAVDLSTSEILSSVTESLFSGQIDSTDSTGFPVAGKRVPRYTTKVRVSFYSSEPRQTDATPCIPADGSNLCLMAQNGTVDAIAANFLRLGTVVEFPELVIGETSFTGQQYVARDRMNARYNGSRYVDIYVAVLDENGKVDPKASRAKAKSLGVKHTVMNVY